MHRHRLAPGADYYRLPRPPAPAVAPAQFFAFPVACLPPGVSAAGLAPIYQAAFEQAQAVARPSLLERDLLAAWN
jgi:hypothetical protein